MRTIVINRSDFTLSPDTVGSFDNDVLRPLKIPALQYAAISSVALSVSSFLAMAGDDKVLVSG